MSFDPEMLKRINDVVNEKIRPALQMDGGDISIVSLEGNVLTVALYGACSNCPRSSETLKMGIERVLRQSVSNTLVVNAQSNKNFL